MESKRYTIGQMAELCGLSKKQLRYYDSIDILSPRHRDPVTGYRYYTEGQIEEILLLQELRKLDLPLETIGRLLSHRDLPQLQAVLRGHLMTLRQELLARQQQYDRIVDSLLWLIQSASLAEASDRQEIKLVTVPERTVFFTRYVSAWNANQLFIRRRAELLTLAEAEGRHLAGPNLAIFHSGYLAQFSDRAQDAQGDLEVCMALAQGGPAASGPHIRTIPTVTAVSCLHFGHYRYMEGAYRAMEAWAAERDLRLGDAAVEEYLIGATATGDPGDYVTRLYIPLEGSQL